MYFSSPFACPKVGTDDSNTPEDSLKRVWAVPKILDYICTYLNNQSISSIVPPLFVIEFLHRVVDTFGDYFGDCSEATIKDNYVVVYELLDEMLDNGFPLATESNILKELIKPPNILRTVVNTVTGKSK